MRICIPLQPHFHSYRARVDDDGDWNVERHTVPHPYTVARFDSKEEAVAHARYLNAIRWAEVNGLSWEAYDAMLRGDADDQHQRPRSWLDVFLFRRSKSLQPANRRRRR